MNKLLERADSRNSQNNAFDKDFIQKVKERDLRQFLEDAEGMQFNQSGHTICPFHDDSEPSLHVSKKDGVWKWYCHSVECEKGGTNIDYVMQKYNKDFLKAVSILARFHKLKMPEQEKKVVAEYLYKDEKGKLLYTMLRYEVADFSGGKKKGFSADRNMDGVRRVLFRLPKVMKTDEVWVVEGEKDADNISELGLVGTTWAFGIAGWRSSYADFLKDKKVRLCLDNDVPEKTIIKIASSIIQAKAEEVKIIKLPDLKKKDISDWITQHDTHEDLKGWLEKVIDETLPFVLPENNKIEIKNSFLTKYINSISPCTDAPQLFILFSGISLLSTILNRFYFKYPRPVYLNLYTLLLAPSTSYRKSICLDILSDHVSLVNPELLLPDQFTTESLMDILAEHNSRGLIVWRELIQVKEFCFGSDYNRGLPSLLTNVYDCSSKIQRRTRNGEQIVDSPKLTIAAAGISDWLLENLRTVDFQGGIWTRFLFIPVQKDGERKWQFPKDFIMDGNIIDGLKNLDVLEPKQMNLSKIRLPLQTWAMKHMKDCEGLNNPLLRASFERLEVSLLKIACLLQIAEDGSNTVDTPAFEDAAKIIDHLKSILPDFFSEEVAFDGFSKALNRVRKLLKDKKEMKQSDIWKFANVGANWGRQIIEQLIEEGIIEPGTVQADGAGRPGKIYRYIGT